MHPRKDYKNLLLIQAEKDKAENLLIDNIDINRCENIKREMRINFKCNCRNIDNKNIRCAIEKSGLFCKECTLKIKKKKIKASNMKKYGVEHPMHNKEIKDKIKASIMEKYGVEHPSQSKIVKDKIKATNMEKYGVEHPLQNKEVQDKMKATNMKKYGVENPMHNKEIKDKLKATNMEKYGVEHSLQNKEVQDKIKASIMEKYGVEHPSQSKIVKDKIKETNMKNLGVENPMQNKEVQDKKKATNMKNLGVEHPSQSEIVKDKIKATNMKNLGVEHPSQSEIVKDKKKSTNMKNLGVEHPMQNKYIFEKCQKNLFKLKIYKFKSGEEDNCQGYEPLAIKELEELHNYTYKDYKNWNNLEFYYEINNKKHKYYPDIPFIRMNKIIEVKSNYTFYKDLYKNLKKAECVIKQGFDFEVWIYDSKFNKLIFNNKTIKLKEELHKELLEKKFK